MRTVKNKRQITQAKIEAPQRPEDSYDIDYQALCREQGEVIAHLNRLIDTYQKSLNKRDLLEHSIKYDSSRTEIFDTITSGSNEQSLLALNVLLKHLDVTSDGAKKTVVQMCRRLHKQYNTIRRLMRLEDAAMQYLDPFMTQLFGHVNGDDDDEDDGSWY